MSASRTSAISTLIFFAILAATFLGIQFNNASGDDTHWGATAAITTTVCPADTHWDVTSQTCVPNTADTHW